MVFSTLGAICATAALVAFLATASAVFLIGSLVIVAVGISTVLAVQCRVRALLLPISTYLVSSRKGQSFGVPQIALKQH